MNFTENDHPFMFLDNTTWTFYFYISVTVIYITLSLPANCYILWLMQTGKGARCVSDIFSFNLAVGEIFYGCGTLISYAILTSSAYAQFLSIIGVIPIFARPLFLCLICVERYLAVVYPLTFLKGKPLRYRLACSAVAWVVVAGFAIFLMFIFSSNNMHIFICVALPHYSLFLTIKLICCVTVLRALKLPGPGERGRQRAESNRMKRRAITDILILTVSMVINYAPIFIVGITFGILPVKYFTGLLTIGVSISMLVAFAQPILYIKQFGNTKLMFRNIWNS